MPELVEKLLVKRCQDHIAMARRSGAIGGGGKIRSLGEVTGLLIADDASEETTPSAVMWIMTGSSL